MVNIITQSVRNAFTRKSSVGSTGVFTPRGLTRGSTLGSLSPRNFNLLRRRSSVVPLGDDIPSKGTKVIDPTSNYKLAWDVLGSILIVYSVLVTTTRLCFRIEVPHTSLMAIVDYGVDFTFLVDIVINFMTGYYDENERLITDMGMIARQYMKTWFILDFASTVPFDVIVDVLANTSADGLQALALIRILRLLKLARLRKLNKLIENVEDTLGVHPSIMELARLMMYILFSSHFLGCCFYWLSTMKGEVGFFATLMIEDLPLSTRYLISICWSLATLTAVGYGDAYAITTSERIFTILVEIIGASFFGYMLGNINSILSTINVKRNYRTNKMLQVNDYLHERSFPKDLCAEVKAHVRYYISKKEVFNVGEVLSSLSSSLHREFVLQTYFPIRSKFAIFRENDSKFLMDFVKVLCPVFYLPSQTIAEEGEDMTEMHFITEGRVHFTHDTAASQEDASLCDALSELEASPESPGSIPESPTPGTGFTEKKAPDSQRIVGVYASGSILFLNVIGQELEHFKCSAATFCDMYLINENHLDGILRSYPNVRQSMGDLATERADKMAMCMKFRPQRITTYVGGEARKTRISEKVVVNDEVISYKDLPQTIEGGYHIPSIGSRRFSRLGKMQAALDEAKRKPEDGAGKVRSTRMTRFRRAVRDSFVNSVMEGKKVEWRSDTGKRFILHPDSNLKQRWEVALCFLIVYSAVTVPFMIAFDQDPEVVSTFGMIELLVDIYFIMDIVINFRTAYYTSSVTSGKVLIVDAQKIAKTYVMSKWFYIDFLSSFPFDRVIIIQGMRSLKLARMLRLVRLLKLVKLGNFIEKLDDDFPTLMQSGRLMMQVTFVAHFLACIWYYASEAGSETCHRSFPSSVSGRQYKLCNWATLEEYEGNDSVGKLYLAALYWAFTSMTTVGYGDIVAGSDDEMMVSILGMLIGVTVFAYVVGSMSIVVSQMNSREKGIKKKLDGLKVFLNEKNISPGLQRRLKLYYDHYLKKLYTHHEESLLNIMPDRLRRKCLYQTNGRKLAALPFFEGWQEAYLAHCSFFVKKQYYKEKEMIYSTGDAGEDMFIILRGSVEIVGDGGRIHLTLGEGSTFGETALIASMQRTTSARAKQHTSIFSLAGKHFRSLLQRSAMQRNDAVKTTMRRVASSICSMDFETVDTKRKIMDALKEYNVNMANPLVRYDSTRIAGMGMGLDQDQEKKGFRRASLDRSLTLEIGEEKTPQRKANDLAPIKKGVTFSVDTAGDYPKDPNEAAPATESEKNNDTEANTKTKRSVKFADDADGTDENNDATDGGKE